MVLFRLLGFCTVVLTYRVTIRSGDDGDREFIGSIDLRNEDAALAFGNDAISDMMCGNSDQYVGWTMDIAEGQRAVCSVAFPSAAPIPTKSAA
jgi:hypothetical protein